MAAAKPNYMPCPCCPKTSGSKINRKGPGDRLVKCTRDHVFEVSYAKKAGGLTTDPDERWITVAVKPGDQGGCQKGDRFEVPADVDLP